MQSSLDVEAQALEHQDTGDTKGPPGRQVTDDTKGPDPKSGDTSAPAPKYGDTSATYWKLYESEAKISDNNFVDSLKGNTNSMVILSTLFSSIVASFIIEIYKNLLPGNNQQPNSRRVNIVLFLSFFLSIVSAVTCALIQQWCDEYLNFANPRSAPHERGRVRTYLYQGLDQFQMRRFMYWIYVLLHISVFLFFLAISDFFYTVDHLFGLAAFCALMVSLAIYTLLSISPLIFSNSPYNTPMTPPLRAGYFILLVSIRWCTRWFRGHSFDLHGLRYYKGIHFDRALLYSTKAEQLADILEPYAMKWLFTENDFSDNDMDRFLEGLPGYMSSKHTKTGHLDQYLTADHILNRIREHFITCATSVELSEEASTDRVSSCVKAYLRIFKYSREQIQQKGTPRELKGVLESQKEYGEKLINHFQTLCGMDDPTIALRASCIRALAVQGLLSQLDRPNGNPPFYVSLIPTYKFFFPNDDTDAIQLDDGDAPDVKRMWKKLLHDGPLANLTMLAQAVRDREHAPPSSFSFCWKAFDILLTQLGTIHPDESTGTYNDFDHLHKDTHTYVHEQRGFRVAPLLDILDTVARGRRLLMVLAGHSKYQNRAKIVFGKDHLRNGDLLEAFAHRLPDFISNNTPEVCRDFMENVVHEDHLWTSLQINLWNTLKSDKPIPDQLRVFEDCCIVIDLAFSVLEDSQKVDWRAPEFGSLAQLFEAFIAHYFQGGFMGRATSFRIGVLKARFCGAILAQFSNDIEREGAVFFRSQWDVASLARVIHTLGLRDKEDPEFWNSYVDGGHIGTKFMAKAVEMIDITERDGPLLIFCQLGHLVSTAVPLNQSGLLLTDIEKVLELQGKVINNEHLLSNRPSDTVWEELGQLQEQVKDLCSKPTSKEIEILQRLLGMIEDVSNLRSKSHIQSEPAEEQGPRTSAAMSPTSSSGESRGIGNRLSFASGSTAVTGGSPSGTETIEGEGGFERTPGVGIMDRSTRPSLSTIQPVIPYVYMGDARQRRENTYSRTASGFIFTSPTVVTRSSTTGVPLASPRDAPTVPPIPAISASYGSLDPDDGGQSGARSGTSLTSEPEEFEG